MLGVARGADEEAVKKAYRRLALQWHPDKHSAGGEEERLDATERFKRIQHAYGVLSDAAERRFYDEHGADELDAEEVAAGLVDIAGLFSPDAFEGFAEGDARSFYAVYGAAFARIAEEERRYAEQPPAAGSAGGGGGGGGDAAGAGPPPPAFGAAQAAPSEVVAFYAFWTAYQSRMHFGWADEHDAREGRNREERRYMEKANERARRAARRRRTEAIRALASFVRRRDKRYAALQAEAKRRAEEAEARKRATALEVAAAAARSRLEEAAAHRAALEAREAELEAAGTFRLAVHDGDAGGGGGRRRRGGGGGGGSGGAQVVRRSGIAAEVVGGSATAAAGAGSAGAAAAAWAPAPAAAAAPGAAAVARGEGDGEEEEEDDEDEPPLLFCAACRKTFKSEAALRNHAGSRKHAQAVEALAAAAADDESEESGGEGDGEEREEEGADEDDEEEEETGGGASEDGEEDEAAPAAAAAAAALAAAAARAAAAAAGAAKPKLNKTELRRLRKKEEAGKARETGGAGGGGGGDGDGDGETAFKIAVPQLTGGAKGRPMAATAYDQTVRNKLAGGLACASCKEIFATRNELFSHIKALGHAVVGGGDLHSAIDERGVGGGGGSGGKAAARKLKNRAKRAE